METLRPGRLVEARITTTFGTETVVGRIIESGEGWMTVEGMHTVTHLTGVPLPFTVEEPATRFLPQSTRGRWHQVTVLE